MKKFLAVLTLICILALTVGCAAAAPKAAVQHSAQPAAAPAPAQEAASGAAPATGSQTAGTGAGVPNDAARMIVRNVDLSLVVTDAQATMQSIMKLATDAGGYVSDSNAWRDGEQLRGTMTLRIPDKGLDSALASLHALAVRVERENITGQDVTEEYTDLNAQLTNLEATEKELRELLSEVRQKTQKAEDVLQVYRELTTIRGEIERVKGRMQYLQNLTGMATLKIELVPDLLAKPVVEPGWRPLETLKNASRASVNAMKGVVDAGIWLIIYVVPLLIMIAIPFVLVFLAIRWLVRRGRRSSQKKDLSSSTAAP
jgi:hypothetical protein